MARITPADRLAILNRQKAVAGLYLRGETQWAIAHALGVDQGTVSRDLKALRTEWRKSALMAIDARKEQELAKVDEVERMAFAAYARSQEDEETLRAKVVKTPGKAAGDAPAVPEERSETQKTSKGQCGDPRFLKIVLGCVERRCKILGIDQYKVILTAPIEILDARPEEPPCTPGSSNTPTSADA
jgi:hypothetical protein